MFAAFLTTLLFSLSAVSGRRLVARLSGTQANLSRLLVAALVTGLWAHLAGFGLGGAAFPLLFLSGCIGFGIGDLALFQSYPRIGTRRTMVMVQCLAAPLAALTEWVWLGDVPTARQALCGAIILLGVGIALMPSRHDSHPVVDLRTGIFFGFIAALCQAWGAVISRKAYAVAAEAGQTIAGAGDGVTVAYQRLLGGILVTGIFFAYQRARHPELFRVKPDWRGAMPLVTANALFGPSLGVACYQWALSSAPTSLVMPTVATTPLVVMPFTRIIEKERITPRALLGGAIAVIGVIGLTIAAGR
jgi:drug/metabolite transporter (DMT)-like permease